MPCEYCQSKTLNTTGCGLDRKDSSKGYVKENVVPCCTSCNKIKNKELTYEEMKLAMEAILKFRSIKSDGQDMTGLVEVKKKND